MRTIDTKHPREYCASIMNDTEMLKSAITKTLAVIGFFVIVALIISLIIIGAQKVPTGFSSLASIVENMEEYRKDQRPVAQGTQTNTNDVIPSDAVHEETSTVTIVLPFEEVRQPQLSTGYSDLSMSVLGSGIIESGRFSFVKRFDRDKNNAIRFDVKNIGTKASGVWSFTVRLPNGELYTSVPQVSLNPNDHIEFTLGFYLTDVKKDTVALTSTLVSTNDSNSKNNTATLTVEVKD